MTLLVKQAPPQHLILRETPKDSISISLGFAIYDRDVIGWRTFYQLCHNGGERWRTAEEEPEEGSG
jgi:hypothetical protein